MGVGRTVVRRNGGAALSSSTPQRSNWLAAKDLINSVTVNTWYMVLCRDARQQGFPEGGDLGAAKRSLGSGGIATASLRQEHRSKKRGHRNDGQQTVGCALGKNRRAR